MELTILGQSVRLEILALIAVIGAVLGSHLFGSCCRFSMKEGLMVLNPANVGNESSNVTSDSWATPYLTGATQKNKSVGPYEGDVPPLKDGQLDMFANNKFSADCCNSTLSTSTGCACVTKEQVDYINTRGGNRS